MTTLSSWLFILGVCLAVLGVWHLLDHFAERIARHRQQLRADAVREEMDRIVKLGDYRRGR